MSDAKAISVTDLFTPKAGFSSRLPVAAETYTLRGDEDLYQKGLLEGQLLAEAAFGVERQRLEQLVASADALSYDDNPEILTLLDQTIRTIVHKIAGNASFEADFLAKQIEAAAALLVEADQARVICLHPDDFALLENAALPLPCKADPSMPLGGIRIDCSVGWIQHGPAYTLQRIDDAFSIGAVL